MYQMPIRDMDQLKQCLVDVQQTVGDAVIGEWRKRFRARICAKGHHFEHLLNFFTLSVVCLAYSFKHHSANV